MQNHDKSPFGTELRRRREAAGITLGELASRLHYNKGYLSKIENGSRRPSLDLARRCDTELDAGGALAALAPAREFVTVEAPDTEGSDVWVMSLDPAGREEFSSVDRRGFVRLGGAVLAGWAVEMTPAPKHSDPATLHSFRSVFDEVRMIGQAAPPVAVLPTVIALAYTLRLMAVAAAPDARDQMFVMAARFAEYAGWMAQEAGSDDGALWWTRQAVQLAAFGGDHELAAFGLVRQALIALYRRDAAATIALAKRAQADRYRPRIRGLAAQREAQGYAMAGDYNECRRALDRAAVLLQRADEDGQPILGTSTVDDPVALTTGWCMYDLGRPGEAARILDKELVHISPHAHRARARYAARHALALTGIGEVEHACAAVEPVLAALARVDSATIRTDLRQLLHQLARWRTAAPVRHLMPQLTAALHTTAAAASTPPSGSRCSTRSPR